MDIVKMKKKAFNFFATVDVAKFVYVDDVATPVDVEDMASASTFQLYMECGNDHYAKTFDNIEYFLDKRR
eukprot:4729599-Heterocapsa_arctica.AAC.1